MPEHMVDLDNDGPWDVGLWYRPLAVLSVTVLLVLIIVSYSPE